MPYQNRVSPYSQLVATPARGTLMGNRGCLHDTGDRPLRQYQSRRWIICVLDFKGRTRRPMPPGQYTSLFFLDEATALAAGHRPCAECQRTCFTMFQRCWSAANTALIGQAIATADLIDRVLHRERISDYQYQRDKIKRTYTEHLDLLPDGTLVAFESEGTPCGLLLPWSFEGYGDPIARLARMVEVLTPRSTVRALVQGYLPEIHPSAVTARDRHQ